MCDSVGEVKPAKFRYIFWEIFDSNIKVDTKYGFVLSGGKFSQNIKVVSPTANSE